jgi:hypothetical protein
MATRLLASALVALSLAACGEDESAEPSQEVTATLKPTPAGCLEEAGLSGVEKRDKNLWRGFTDDATVVLIDRFETPAEARRAVRQADLVVSEAVGRYFVHGPVIEADDGSTAAVASCILGD